MRNKKKMGRNSYLKKKIEEKFLASRNAFFDYIKKQKKHFSQF